MSIVATLNRKAALAAIDAIDSGNPHPTLTLTVREVADLLNEVVDSGRARRVQRTIADRDVLVQKLDDQAGTLRAAVSYALDTFANLSETLQPAELRTDAVVDLAGSVASMATETLTRMTAEYL